jgi:hypothetical protein
MSTGPSVPEAAGRTVQQVYWPQRQEVEPSNLHFGGVAWGVEQSVQDQLPWDREYTGQS